jgi:hypothetical protein
MCKIRIIKNINYEINYVKAKLLPIPSVSTNKTKIQLQEVIPKKHFSKNHPTANTKNSNIVTYQDFINGSYEQIRTNYIFNQTLPKATSSDNRRNFSRIG